MHRFVFSVLGLCVIYSVIVALRVRIYANKCAYSAIPRSGIMNPGQNEPHVIQRSVTIYMFPMHTYAYVYTQVYAYVRVNARVHTNASVNADACV